MSDAAALETRMRYLLEHQASMLEALAATLSELKQNSPREQLQSVLEKQERQSDSLLQWQAELEGMSAEWQSASVPQEERGAMRALADQVRELAATVTAHCERAAQIAASRAQATAAELIQLRKSRTVLRNYRSQKALDALFIDKKT